MKNREQIITDMCYTMRHDYGLEKDLGNGFISELSAGMTQTEREALWRQMAQVFDNNIAPVLENYTKLVTGEAVCLPISQDHARAMLRVADFYLKQSKTD